MRREKNNSRGIKTIPLLLFCLLGLLSFSQEKKDETVVKKDDDKKEVGKISKKDISSEVVKYRRSSLHTMIIEDKNLPKSDLILKTFNEAPFPDKFNNHTVGERSFNLQEYKETSKDVDEKELAPVIENYFKQNKTANNIVAKWFNRTEEGAFDMNLIQDRGAYDASVQDAAKAASTQRGLDILKDAGIELLSNTFVVVNYSKFVSNEIVAKAAYDVAIDAVGNKDDPLSEGARSLAKNSYEKARQGYSVWTTAYLYQLVWTDSVEAYFWNDYWLDSSSIDVNKKMKFDTTNFFSLKLLGFQKSSSLISGLGSNAQNEEMIIKNATLKSINSVYNKLQRKFEPFRTKTPLVSIDPLGAKIGLKEGLEKNDRYEVLMPQYDAEGKLEYKRKGVIKVQKNKIWDNRFNAGEEPLDENGNPMEPENDLEFTHFKGSSRGFFPGMLIRQLN